jgi:methyl-accepting chemotaxis protein
MAERSSSFRTRLTVFVIGLGLVPLILFGLIVTWQFQSSITRQVNSSLTSDADTIHQLVEDSDSDNKKNAQSWAADAIVIGALVYNSYDKSDIVLKGFQNRFPEFRVVALFTPDGRAVSASDPAIKQTLVEKQAAVAASDWFRAALQNKWSSEGLEHEDPILGQQVLYFAAPVIAPVDGKLIGVLVAAYDWTGRTAETVAPAVARAAARGYSSFEVVVARNDGTVLFDSHHKDEALSTASVTELINSADQEHVAQAGDKVGIVIRGMGSAGLVWTYLAVVDKAEAYAPVRSAKQIAVLLAVLFGTAAAFISLLMARRLVRPINTLNLAVDRIVREGDLTQRIAIETQDEIGQLAGTFSKMVVRLRDIPFSLNESSRLLTESVSNLSGSTAEQSESINRQAAALQETQVTVQEIKQTSLLAAQKAEAVLNVAERAQEIGREGENAIERSLGALTSIREQVEEIAAKISGLTERTRQIGLITETVKDLADQSNMLALNAAIEAVRSGEHGKGFAVVAREIRSLADQSIQATVRVREVLEDIAAATQTAVTITEKGAARMESGFVQVRTSGESLRALSGIVKENAAAVRQIAAAVSQQNAGITQIFAAVTDLNKMMDETVKRLEATSKSVDILRDVTGKVSNVVKSFRV